MTTITDKVYKPPELVDTLFPSLSSTAASPASSVAGSVKYEYAPPEIPQVNFPTAITARNLVGATLDTQSRKILGSFSFTRVGAIVAGSVNGPGVAMSQIGIVGKNSAGAVTFSIDATTGSATFLGTLKVGSTIEAGALVVGTNVGLGTAQTAGQVTTIVGNVVTTGYVNALNVTANSVNAGWVYANTIQANQIQALTINANQITAGTITVGGTNQPTSLVINQSSLTGNARLGWQGGSRMWEDSSSSIGINSIGTMYIYVNSSQKLIIPSNGQTTMEGGANMTGNLNVSNGWTTHLTGQLNVDYDYVNLSSQTFRLADMGLTSSKTAANQGQLRWGNGATIVVDATGSWFHINGNDKSAIVPTRDGYHALYCVEAPEVWFFDFCKDKKHIDPMFIEVTEGEMRFIKCDVGYQVWRRRRGHAHKRFEPKTFLQFIKNERFLSLSK